MAMQDRNEDSPMKVLVVDDDPLVVTLLSVILGGHNFEVLEATSGQQGLELVKTGSPDVVLLDIMMKDIDGFEVFERMKLDPEIDDIPVVYLTASTDQGCIERAVELGANGYIIKPFSPPALRAFLRETATSRREETCVMKPA